MHLGIEEIIFFKLRLVVFVFDFVEDGLESYCWLRIPTADSEPWLECAHLSLDCGKSLGDEVECICIGA